jgi:uncharacterized protein (TIGR02996 family)
VSEDEAFVRGIIDRPGEDAARLVYADWLDERDDPRGAYLRAEHAHSAKPTSAAEKKLAKLAKPLDAVWVARVSRPPVGVCCEQVTFTKRGPVLNAADIDRLEARFGNFGAQFRAFLLNYNGGEPQPACLAYPEAAGALRADIDLEVTGLFKLRRTDDPESDGTDSFGDIEDAHEFLEELYAIGGHDGPNPLIARKLAIAHTQDDLGYILIGTGGKNRGKVYHFRDYCHNTDNPQNLFDFFPTFAEFLAQLRPEREAN